LGEPFANSFAAASKHARVLVRAALVGRRVAGRTHVCRLALAPLDEAVRWLVRVQRFWPERLEALDVELRREDEAS